MVLQLFLLICQPLDLSDMLLLPETQLVDLLFHLGFHLEGLTASLLELRRFLVELGERFLGDRLLNSEYFLQDTDVFLQCASDFLILFELGS